MKERLENDSELEIMKEKKMLQKFVGHSKSFLSQVASSRPHTYQKEHD